MAFAAYFVFNEAVKGGGYVAVPDVVGLPVIKASHVLAEKGLEVGQQKHVVSDHFPEYHVMLQRPAAHKVVRSGRRISLTVSAGKKYEEAPDLVGKDLKAALDTLEGTRLLVGPIARMPYDAPRDLVLAQDPAPARGVPAGGEIRLLVSDGPVAQPLFMPSLVGRRLENALESLAGLNVNAIPYKVDRAWAEYDVVLAQEPDAGTLLYEQQVVKFDVRLLPTSSLPNAWRKVDVVYTVPNTSFSPHVRADVVDRHGKRRILFPLPKDFIDGSPPRLEPGTRITIEVSFLEQATLEFYADGQLDRSYFYEGDADPVITDFGEPFPIEEPTYQAGGADGAGEPLVTVFEPTSTRISPIARPPSYP